jgi:hypothetical protein
MEKTSKITACEWAKEYTGQYGVTHFHTITLENGDTGQIGAKEKMSSKLAVGTELTYTIEAGQYGNKIKAVVNQSKPFQKKEANVSAFAASYTKDLIIAGKADLEQFETVATRILNWIKNN